MRIRSAITAFFVPIFAVNMVFAKAVDKAAVYPGKAVKIQAPAVNEAKAKEMKDILSKLVRQDEYLDEAIETLESRDAGLAAEDISAIGLGLRMIRNNLEQISAMNRKQFSDIQPYTSLSVYTRAIFSYSRKVTAKSAQLGQIVSAALAKGRKPAMRDAVSSKRSAKKGGKSLTGLLKKRQALETLSNDAKKLITSAKKLNAASKWLYIVSK